MSDSINWAWSDPSDSDFDHVDVYINGVFKNNVQKGDKSYTATGLTSDSVYEIGTHTVDVSGNINSAWKNDTERTAKEVLPPSNKTIRFITIGDPHITSNTGSDQYKRLTDAINYINGRSDVDFIVQVGDLVDSATATNFKVAKALMDKLNKPYYVVPGNHDLGGSISTFNGYFGPAEKIININGYQLIFIGISADASGTNHWSFDFGTADKKLPTVIFNHAPVQPAPGKTSCVGSWGSYYEYSCDMKPNVDSFTKLVGFFSGHVHIGTNQTIGGAVYVTEDNLGGMGPATDYIGYTVIKDNVGKYTLLKYN